MSEKPIVDLHILDNNEVVALSRPSISLIIEIHSLNLFKLDSRIKCNECVGLGRF